MERVTPAGILHRQLNCQDTRTNVSASWRETTALIHRLSLADRLRAVDCLFGRDGRVAFQVGQALAMKVRNAPLGQQPKSVANLAKGRSIPLLVRQCIPAS